MDDLKVDGKYLDSESYLMLKWIKVDETYRSRSIMMNRINKKVYKKSRTKIYDATLNISISSTKRRMNFAVRLRNEKKKEKEIIEWAQSNGEKLG